MIGIAIALSLCVGSCLGQSLDMAGYNVTQQQYFQLEDLNSDGVITKDETLAQLSRYDLNGNGKVSRHEYVETICQAFPDLFPFAHYLYDSIDLNNDHTIDAPDYDLVFAKMDLNADGQVSYEEYYAYKRKSLDQFLHAGQHELHEHTHSSCH